MYIVAAESRCIRIITQHVQCQTEQRGAPNDAIEVHRPSEREREREAEKRREKEKERADRTFVRYCYSVGGTHPAQRE